MKHLPLMALSFLAVIGMGCAIGHPAFAKDEQRPFPVPSKFKVSVYFDKNNYLLGENVLAHYRVENTGNTAFKMDTGKDYRGAPRAMRYQIKATGPDGSTCADPYPGAMSMGGIGPEYFELKPGEKYDEAVPIMRYCHIEKPGKYGISIAHDLGWNVGKQNTTQSSAEITLTMPSKDQAGRIIDNRYKSEHIILDFNSFNQSAYLPGLVKRVNRFLATNNRSKNFKKLKEEAHEALIGISSISSTEATATLLHLAGIKQQDIALGAASLLILRLPDPKGLDATAVNGFFWSAEICNEERLSRVVKAWNPRFIPPAQKLGRALLAKDDIKQLTLGAFMVEAVGTKADVKPLIAALDRAIIKTKGGEADQRNDTLGRLFGNATNFLRFYTSIPLTPRSDAEKALYLTALINDPTFRPAGWQPKYRALIKDGDPYIKDLSVSNMSKMKNLMPERSLSKLLHDPDPKVQCNTCLTITKEKDVSFRQPILGLIRMTKNCSVLSAARTAAAALGTNYDALEIIASRLDEKGGIKESSGDFPEMTVLGREFGVCVPLVYGCIDMTGTNGMNMMSTGKGDQQAKTKTAWLKLLKESEQFLRAGNKFKVGDQHLAKDLFPPGFRINLSNGNYWPKND